MAFLGLSPLVIEDVVDESERIVVRARTPRSVRCAGRRRSGCTAIADGSWPMFRSTGAGWWSVCGCGSLVCPTRGCRHTFRETARVAGPVERPSRSRSRSRPQDLDTGSSTRTAHSSRCRVGRSPATAWTRTSSPDWRPAWGPSPCSPASAPRRRGTLPVPPVPGRRLHRGPRRPDLRSPPA
jgi:hypothetical protein